MNLRAVDLNLLVVFEALLGERSVTRAARSISMSQPAVSDALARLRTLLGDELFVRTPGGMQPTQKALELSEPIGEALRQVRSALETQVPFNPATAQRTFRIGSVDYTELVLLPPLNDYLRRVAPDIDIRLVGVTDRTAIEKLDRGEIDVAIHAFAADLPKRVSVTRLLVERAMCLTRCDHPALDKGGLTLALYASLPHIAQSLSGEAGDNNVDRALAQHGLKRRTAVTVTNFMALPYVIGSTDLVATQPERVVRRLATLANLAVHEPPLPLPSWEISMAWNRGSTRDSAMTWFREMLLTICRGL